MIRQPVVTLAATALLAACSGGGSESDRTRSAGIAEDTAPAAVDHSAHLGGDSTASGNAGAAMAGIDHSAMAASGTTASGTASATASHEGHVAAPIPGGAQDHAALGHEAASAAPSNAGGGPAVMDHADMPDMGPSTDPASAASAAEHAAHLAPATPSDRATPPSAGPGVSGAGAEELASLAADSIDAKLLLLGRALVQDSLVQQRIEQDPALREAWEDPEVRAVITSGSPR